MINSLLLLQIAQQLQSPLFEGEGSDAFAEGELDALSENIHFLGEREVELVPGIVEARLLKIDDIRLNCFFNIF